MRGSSASARVQIVVAQKGQVYLLPEHRWRSSSASTTAARTRWVTGPTTSNERAGNRLASRRCIGRHA